MNYTDTVVTTGDAARILDVTPSTIKRWADAGLIPFTRTVGGHFRFDRAELEAIKAANTHPTKEAS